MSTATIPLDTQPGAAERARRWSAVPPTARQKFEKLEAEARHVEAACSAAWQAVEDVRRALRQAEERLRQLTAETLQAGTRPDKSLREDLQAEIEHNRDRAATLERQHDEMRVRVNSTLRLLAGCRKYLGIGGGAL